MTVHSRLNVKWMNEFLKDTEWFWILNCCGFSSYNTIQPYCWHALFLSLNNPHLFKWPLGAWCYAHSSLYCAKTTDEAPCALGSNRGLGTYSLDISPANFLRILQRMKGPEALGELEKSKHSTDFSGSIVEERMYQKWAFHLPVSFVHCSASNNSSAKLEKF